MTTKKRWSTYGEWRGNAYPPISWTLLRKSLNEKYELKDLTVISIERTAYVQNKKIITCLFPGKVVYRTKDE